MYIVDFQHFTSSLDFRFVLMLTLLALVEASGLVQAFDLLRRN